MDITTFDGAAFLATLEPPRFRGERREHVGVVLSAQEWLHFEARMHALPAMPIDDQEALVREITDAIFPRRWWQWWRPRASSELLRLPMAAQTEAFASFYVAQAAIQQTTTPGRPTRAHQTTSSSASSR